MNSTFPHATLYIEFLLFLKQGSKPRFRLPPYGLCYGAEAFRQAHSFAFPGPFFPNKICFFFFRINEQMSKWH